MSTTSKSLSRCTSGAQHGRACFFSSAQRSCRQRFAGGAFVASPIGNTWFLKMDDAWTCSLLRSHTHETLWWSRSTSCRWNNAVHNHVRRVRVLCWTRRQRESNRRLFSTGFFPWLVLGSVFFFISCAFECCLRLVEMPATVFGNLITACWTKSKAAAMMWAQLQRIAN